jgi:hypothetical protein
MITIAELTETMQTLLISKAGELEKTGFNQRERKVTGAGFAQALIFSFISQPTLTRQDVNQTAANPGLYDSAVNAGGK